jgi:hypothetical protein
MGRGLTQKQRKRRPPRAVSCGIMELEMARSKAESLPRLLQRHRTSEGRVVQAVDFVPVCALDQVAVDVHGRLGAGVAYLFL